MTVLWAARWALLGSIVIYAAGLVVGLVVEHDLGLLMALIGAFAMSITALACVVAQLRLWLHRKRADL